MGGYDGTERMNSCEYFDPETMEWLPGPDMSKRRFVAFLLVDWSNLATVLILCDLQKRRRCNNGTRWRYLRRRRHRSVLLLPADTSLSDEPLSR